jgi:hypothetical protein
MMNKKVGVSIGVVLALAVAAVAYWFIEANIQSDSNIKMIDFIAEHYNSKGELIDYFDEIGCSGIDDIHFTVKGDDVRLFFGDITMEWSSKDFVTEETQKQLEKIYIKMYKDKETGKLRLFYKGTEIERWAS